MTMPLDHDGYPDLRYIRIQYELELKERMRKIRQDDPEYFEKKNNGEKR